MSISGGYRKFYFNGRMHVRVYFIAPVTYPSGGTVHRLTQGYYVEAGNGIASAPRFSVRDLA